MCELIFETVDSAVQPWNDDKAKLPMSLTVKLFHEIT